MEIYSLRSIGNFLYKNENKGQRDQASYSQTSSIVGNDGAAEKFEEVVTGYGAITPRQLRERALHGFESGMIDQDTYRQLSAELPMQAIDQQGRIIDLSAVTDDTPFNFRDFYQDQLEIALNVGDHENVGVLRAAVNFLDT